MPRAWSTSTTVCRRTVSLMSGRFPTWFWTRDIFETAAALDITTITALAQGPTAMRRAVASHPDTCAELLDRLAGDAENHVCRAAMTNPTCPAGALAGGNAEHYPHWAHIAQRGLAGLLSTPEEREAAATMLTGGFAGTVAKLALAARAVSSAPTW